MRIIILILLLTSYITGYAQAPVGIFQYGTELSSSGKKVTSVSKSNSSITVSYTRTSVELVEENGQTFRCVSKLSGTETYSADKVEYVEKINDTNDVDCKQITAQVTHTLTDTATPANTVQLTLKSGNVLAYGFSGMNAPLQVWSDTRAYRYKNGKQLNNYKGKYKKLWIYISGQFTPSLAYRNIRIKGIEQNTSEELIRREGNEYSTYGYSCGMQAGVSFQKKHTFFLEYLRMSQGFEATGHSVDWRTGKAVAATGDRIYIFNYDGVGLGYNYSNYEHIVNFVFETGLYHSFLSGNNQLESLFSKKQLIDAGIRKRNWSGKLAAGIGFRPRYGTEFRLMPTLLYNFTSQNKGTFKTNLYNVGLNISACFRIATNVK